MFTLEEAAHLKRMLQVTGFVATGVLIGAVGYFAPGVLRHLPPLMRLTAGGLMLGAAGYFTLF
jgi:hypothetical protein